MRNRRIIAFLITIVCIILPFSIVSSAYTLEKGERLTTDRGENYVTDSEFSRIEKRLREAENSSGVDFRVHIYKQYSSPNVKSVSSYESLVGERFSDLVLLVISYESGTYYYELFTKGSATKDIREKEVGRILDNKGVYDNIKSGKLYEGIDEFITLAEKAVTGTLRNSFKAVFVPALLISLCVATGLSVYVFLRYRKKLHSTSYPLDKYASLSLNVANDNLINRTITSARVSTPSSSGGGRSSGGGGGGSRGRR